MFKCLTTIALGLGLAAGTPAMGDGTLMPTGIFSDGTWDCADGSGVYIGSIVLADQSYAFIRSESTVGTYGKLHRDQWLAVPTFVVLSGELKDRLGVLGMSFQGPLGQPGDYSGELFLNVVITDTTMFRCTRRKGPSD